MAEKTSVLVVEDDYALNDAFKIVLSVSGFDVETVYNGKEALEYLSTHTPDVIILDILMPIMDGREFLKAFENESQIPILALSNLDARSEIDQILELGATKYALKSSASSHELVNLVRETMSTTAVK